jgi:hypothetical protein
MSTDSLPEEWSIIRSWLPGDLDALAKEKKFLRRARGIQDSEIWLRFFLMHVVGGLSLQQTVVRASEFGLPKVSAVALFKRLKKAAPWLQALCAALLDEQRRRAGLMKWPLKRRVLAIDATDVQEPGSTGTKLRVHYAISLPDLQCRHCEITDNSGGEKLGRFQFAKDQLVLVDRGYSHRAGAAHVLKAGAHFLMRWNPAAFPLEEEDGSAFSALAWARRIPAKGAREKALRFRFEGQTYAVRLCARRKSRLATERTLHKMKDKARRNGTKNPDKGAQALAGFFFVLTSVGAGEMPCEEALETYRWRWQVELCFKRLKSLLEGGHVPKSNDDSAKGWMQAKMLSSLLIERILLEADFFSPWGYRFERESVAGGH